MSMNLYITIDGEKQEMFQTPTHITYMCLMTDKGFDSSVKGKKAVRAARAYLEYVNSMKNGVYSDTEEWKKNYESTNKYVNRMFEKIENAKKIEAYAI